MDCEFIERDSFDGLILDFDGTICRLFAHYDLSAVSVEVRKRLEPLGFDFDAARDVFDVFSYITESVEFSEGVREHGYMIAHDSIMKAEIEAVESGVVIQGCEKTLRDIMADGIRVAISTNNSEECVCRWLSKHIPEYSHDIPIYGRIPRHPELMKPSPWTILRAVSTMHLSIDRCIFIGDTVRDYQASELAAVRFVGMAPTHRKKLKLSTYVQEDIIVSDYNELRSLLYI